MLKQKSQVPDMACCCLTLPLALLVALIIVSRKELWFHYVKVVVAAKLAHMCSTEGADSLG